MPYTAPSARYPERGIPGEDDPSAADYEAADPMQIAAMVARRGGTAPDIGPPAPGTPEERALPVVIPQEKWKEFRAGPVPTDGRNILMTGGKPFVGQPLAPWTIEQMAREREEEQQQNIRELLQSVPPSQQSQMMERAIRLQGMFGFQSALQRGVPFMQAYAQFVPQIYYNAPAAQAQAMRTLTPTTQRTPAVPFTPRMLTIDGKQVLQTGPNVARMVPEPKPSITKPETILRVTQNRVKSLQDAYDATFDKTEKAAIKKELDQERAEEKRLVTEIRKQKPSGPVAIGGIYKGYRRIGEDVSKPESWEKVQ